MNPIALTEAETFWATVQPAMMSIAHRELVAMMMEHAQLPQRKNAREHIEATGQLAILIHVQTTPERVALMENAQSQRNQNASECFRELGQPVTMLIALKGLVAWTVYVLRQRRRDAPERFKG